MDLDTIANRAKQLIDSSIDNVRSHYCTAQGITTLSIIEDREQTKGMSKGQMIEIILRNEFSE